MTRGCSRSKRGFTLLEVLVIMTLTAMLTAMAVVLFSALLHAQRQTQQRDRVRRELMRLDVALRSDIHAASGAKAIDQRVTLQHDEPGHRTEFQITDDAIVREHYRDDQLRQREVFALLPGIDAGWSIENVQQRKLLQLQIKFPASSGRVPARLTDFHGEFLVGGVTPADSREMP